MARLLWWWSVELRPRTRLHHLLGIIRRYCVCYLGGLWHRVMDVSRALMLAGSFII